MRNFFLLFLNNERTKKKKDPTNSEPLAIIMAIIGKRGSSEGTA